MKRPLTKAQVKVLREIYASEEPIKLANTHRRTVNVLVRKGLVSFEYRHPAYDKMVCKKVASLERAEREIAKSDQAAIK
tara:strand:+ start:39 stop:275 length:237 start_codon:yes stop_codon:yes gene_type:complete